MKSILGNALAAWANTILSYNDGDVLRESTLDTVIQSTADRLAFLKAAVDGRAKLTGDNSFAGNQVWVSGSAIFGVPVEFTQGIDATGQPLIVGDISADSLTFSTGQGGAKKRPFILPDADHTLASVNHDRYRIPALTAARVYTLTNSAVYNGRVVRFTRPGNEAFAVRIRESSAAPGVYIGTLASGNKGWHDFLCDGGVWKSDGWIQDAATTSNVV